MQRYQSVGPDDMLYPYPYKEGEWVRFSDAEAEIEKAWKQGQMECADEVYRNGVDIRADERERLRKAIFDGIEREGLSITHYMENILKEAFFPKPPAPKPLEKLTIPEQERGITLTHSSLRKINAAIEALNEHLGRKS